MRKKVCSNLAYYYSYTEKMSGMVSTKVQMNDNVDAALLEEAVNEALESFKDFKVQLEVSDNVLYFVDNPNPFHVVKLMETDSCMIRDTQAYLFSIHVEECFIRLDFFHMLMDGIGYFAFLKTILYLYLKKKCPTECDWDKYVAELTNHMLSESSSETIDEDSIFLKRIADITQNRKPMQKEVGAEPFFQLYDKEAQDEDKIVCVHLNRGKLKSLTQQWQIKPYVLVNEIVGNAISEVFTWEDTLEDKQIAAYMPVELRRFLQMENYTYGCLSYINVPHTGREDGYTLQEQCVEANKNLSQYLDSEKAFQNMEADMDLIKIMQKESMPIGKKKKIMQRVMERTAQYRGTFCMSYIPFLKEEEALSRYVKDFRACVPESGIGIACEMIQVGDKVNLIIRYQAHCEEVIRKTMEELKKLSLYTDSFQEEICDLHIALP